MAATKELILTSLGEDSYVDVKENDTLMQVWASVLEELDEEQLPAQDFSFKVNGIRISSKQEGRKLAFDLLANKAKIELVTKKTAEQSSLEEEPENSKRAKTASYITPKEVNESSGSQKAPCEEPLSEKPSPVSLDYRLPSDNADQADKNEDDNFMPQGDDDSREYIGHRVSVDSDEEERTEAVSSKSRDESNVLSEPSNEKTSDAPEEDIENANTNDGIQMFEAENPHKESEEAKEKSNHVLEKLKTLLHDNPLFCSDTRRREWLQEIQNLQEKSTPQTVFGVLGNTGV
jgi:hypothetical protein